MLTMWELRLNLMSFKLCSKLKLLPIKLEWDRGKVVTRIDANKFFWWKCFLMFGMLHWAYVSFRLWDVFFMHANHPDFIQLPPHLTLVLGIAVILFFAIRIFFIRPEVTVALFNVICQDQDPFSDLKMAKARRLWNFQKFSREELVLLSLPLMCGGGPIFFLGLLIKNPKANFALFSGLPIAIQHPGTYLLCLGMECFVYSFWSSTANLIYFIMLLFFQQISSRIKHGIRHLKAINTMDIHNRLHRLSRKFMATVRAYKECRRFQLLIHLFNIKYASIIQGTKIFSTALSILFISFALRYRDEHIFMSIMYAYFGCEVMIGFSVSNEKAFAIPQGMVRYKGMIQLSCKELKIEGMDCRGYQRSIQSVKPLGVKGLKRTTTLNFVATVTRLVVRILLAFR